MRIPLRSNHLRSKKQKSLPRDYSDSIGITEGYSHMGKLYATSEEYYRKVVTGLPLDPDDPRGEAVVDASFHADVCQMLARGGTYAISFNTGSPGIYVDNWNIDSPCLYHRHPELRVLGTKNNLEWDVLDNRCTMCDKQIPGEIWMMWRLQQL